MHAYVDAMRRYAVFRGRSTRAQFWLFTLVLGIILIACSILDVLLGFDKQGALVITGFVYVGHLLPLLAVTVRRLHDIDRTGWWMLLCLVPLAGVVMLIVFACLPSTAGVNRFGPSRPAAGPEAAQATPAEGGL